MRPYLSRCLTVTFAVLFLSLTVFELSAEARAGGGRSFGSRGARSYSRQASPAPAQSAPRQAAPAPGSYQQQAGGGFARSMAGGIMGGMLGSMLFGGMAGASGPGGTPGGGGIGLVEIILLAGGGFVLFRFM